MSWTNGVNYNLIGKFEEIIIFRPFLEMEENHALNAHVFLRLFANSSGRMLSGPADPNFEIFITKLLQICRRMRL